MRSFRGICFFLVTLSLSLCGCSGGSHSNPLPLPPSGLSYTTSIATYTMGTAIIADTPTVSGGAVTAYSVIPALPPGLRLSSSTGAISGTPTARNGHGQLHGNGFELGRERHRGSLHHGE